MGGGRKGRGLTESFGVITFISLGACLSRMEWKEEAAQEAQRGSGLLVPEDIRAECIY